MDHRRADLAAQFTGGDQRGHRRRRDRQAALVDDEAPVGVAVEGQTDIGAGVQDVGLQVDEVGRVQRVGLVVGERAVEFEEQRQQRERSIAPSTAGVVWPAIPFPASTATLSGRTVGVDQRAQEVAVLGQHVAYR